MLKTPLCDTLGIACDGRLQLRRLRRVGTASLPGKFGATLRHMSRMHTERQADRVASARDIRDSVARMGMGDKDTARAPARGSPPAAWASRSE